MPLPFRSSGKSLRNGLVIFFSGALFGVVFYTQVLTIRELSPSEKVLVGNWYSGNGLGSFGLSLGSRGKYSMYARQCMGQTGGGSGTWELADGFVVFHPQRAWGEAEDLKLLLATNLNGNPFLLKMDRSSKSLFQEYGPNRATAFKKDCRW